MNFLDLLFPKKCLECGKAGKYMCSSCLAKVSAAKPICPVCKRYSYNGKTHTFCINKYSLNGFASTYQYDGVIRKAILRLKYNFASALSDELVKNINLKVNFQNTVLVPIPLHPKREKWRGFNQAALLGKQIAQKYKWDFAEKALIRTENTTPQVQLGRKDRLQNIRGKFAVNEKVLSVILKSRSSETIESQPTFIIFDDVWTTGATISESCRVLKKSGAREVWGMTVARG